MQQRYEITLDGLDLSDEQYAELEQALQATVGEFLVRRAGEDAFVAEPLGGEERNLVAPEGGFTRPPLLGLIARPRER